jgi:hypothetical protein
LLEDCELETDERGVRFDPQLFDERLAQPGVGAQRVGLATAAIQRHHELAGKTLPQRVLAHQLREFADECAVFAKRKVCADAILEGCEPQFGQPSDVGLCERLEGEICECLTAPQCERGSQRSRRPCWASRSKRTASIASGDTESR